MNGVPRFDAVIRARYGGSVLPRVGIVMGNGPGQRQMDKVGASRRCLR